MCKAGAKSAATLVESVLTGDDGILAGVDAGTIIADIRHAGAVRTFYGTLAFMIGGSEAVVLEYRGGFASSRVLYKKTLPKPLTCRLS